MDREQLDYLLAQGRLSGSQKERVLAAVLESTAKPSPAAMSTRSRQWIWSLAIAVTAGLLLPVVWVAGDWTESDDMRAKGPDKGVGPWVEAGCAETCRLGETVLFSVAELTEEAHLAAFAVHPNGSRIWYFPSPTGEMPRVQPTAPPIVLNRGIRISNEHAPGGYQLHLILTRSPLSREGIAELERAGFPPDDPSLVIHLEQPLEIQR